MADAFQGQVGANGAGPEAHRTGKVMRTPALGRVRHDRHLHPHSLADQVVVNRADRHQRRNVGGFRRQAIGAIAQDQDFCPALHRRHGPLLQGRNRCPQTRRAIGRAVER